MERARERESIGNARAKEERNRGAISSRVHDVFAFGEMGVAAEGTRIERCALIVD